MGLNICFVKLSTITKCPQLILDAWHFRQDGTCRCDDPEHTVMVGAGYLWDAKVHRWR
ncbi:MAG: hypothetical protein U0R81_16145 [Mycobacterium sp.]